MRNIVQAVNLSKSYGIKILFENLNLNINEGDKVALIAPNGSGKTTLLRIISGRESSDAAGAVSYFPDIKISYLEQDPPYNPEISALEYLATGSKEISSVILEYQMAIESCDQQRTDKALKDMDRVNGWSFEARIKQVLSLVGLSRPERKMDSLSGGERKRAAVASVLLQDPDLMILDEPTNHLDLEVIEYLEEYLRKSPAAVLMVTHDRYFLERVCNNILELDNWNLYQYQGNYSFFLKKREERLEAESADVSRAKNLLRGELDWMRRMPCARGTKAKYRINAFYELKKRSSSSRKEGSVNIEAGFSRLGTKIIECSGVTHRYDDLYTVRDFNYNFVRGEKVGIIGPNGVGKTTFLELLYGRLSPAEGSIARGESVVAGYYEQNGLTYNSEDTVLDVVRKIAETVTSGDGRTIDVSQFLCRFLFPYSTHNTKVANLSGGEKRRLYLVTVLMKSPNLLILDEPTNDLDISTLNVLEEYLAKFKGTLIIVSHDRFFLDKLADHIFIFEGNGVIKDYGGKYSEYREYIKALRREEELSRKSPALPGRGTAPVIEKQSEKNPRKHSYKEQKEIEALESEIEMLEKEKIFLEESISSGTMSVGELMASSERIAEVLKLIESKSDRWLELNL
jgi:ATP-binding cassette subfamily F protein uup